MKDKYITYNDINEVYKLYEKYSKNYYCKEYNNIYTYAVDFFETEEERLAREKAEERSKKLDIILGE
jgi:hypothetical protein